MKNKRSQELGTLPIGKLLVQQAIPASIGILVMSLNILVDTIFVGQWIGPIAIAAINVVLPVSFFIAALGMAIGIGGASIISRSLGKNDKEKALQTFGNQIFITVALTTVLVVLGLVFVNSLIVTFGGNGQIFAPAKIYYQIVLYGVPILALCMMGNNVIRAEGKPKFSMIAMIIPSISNLVMDYVFIYQLDWGMHGAAWATTLSYVFCFSYIVWFFLSDKSEMKINISHFVLKLKIVKEIASLGFVTLARQSVVSVTYLLLNNILFKLGGESSVASYAIISRMLMFALFPVLGITQGFLPIAGYNYGAQQFDRVKESINKAVIYSVGLGIVVFLFIMVFPDQIVRIFTNDTEILNSTPNYMRWVFAATPLVAIQLIGAAHFQAIGNAIPALLLTLTRQGFLFIPLIFILPIYYGELGVWLSFPIADVVSTIITVLFLRKEVKKY